MKSGLGLLTMKRYGLFSLLFMLIAGTCPELFGFTNVARIPDLDYATYMSRIVGVDNDVLVYPTLAGGVIWQLGYDGWEWQVVTERDPQGWLGVDRINPDWMRTLGDHMVVLSEENAPGEFFIPRISILGKQDGLYEVESVHSFAAYFEDPLIWSTGFFWMDLDDDLITMKFQVDRSGEGATFLVLTLIKTAGGWQVGPALPESLQYAYPMFAENIEGVLNLYSLERHGWSPEPPFIYDLIHSQLIAGEWIEISRFEFEHTELLGWNGYSSGLLSGDGSSLLIYEQDMAVQNPARLCELRRDQSGWSYIGDISGEELDLDDLYFQVIGQNQALMRRGHIAALYGGDPPSLQHYHLLEHLNGKWQLTGDIPSHKILTDLDVYDIFHILGNERITIFDIKPYYPTTRMARSYDPANLDPVMISWFKDSVTIDKTTEYLEAFGFFNPIFSHGGWGIWLWHPHLGWLYVTQRDASHFWSWSPASGWTYFHPEWYDVNSANYWMYAGQADDYIWCPVDNQNPRYFYSWKYGEWMSDVITPELDQDTFQEVVDILATELAAEGVVVNIDYSSKIISYTVQELDEGVLVTITMDVQFQYINRLDYSCQSRLLMDILGFSFAAPGKETVYLSPLDMLDQAETVVAEQIIIDFIFQSQTSGIAFTTIDYNNDTVEGPVRERF